jgi:hypothetical protein
MTQTIKIDCPTGATQYQQHTDYMSVHDEETIPIKRNTTLMTPNPFTWGPTGEDFYFWNTLAPLLIPSTHL